MLSVTGWDLVAKLFVRNVGYGGTVLWLFAYRFPIFYRIIRENITTFYISYTLFRDAGHFPVLMDTFSRSKKLHNILHSIPRLNVLSFERKVN